MGDYSLAAGGFAAAIAVWIRAKILVLGTSSSIGTWLYLDWLSGIGITTVRQEMRLPFGGSELGSLNAQVISPSSTFLRLVDLELG